jgi:PKD repeat protein
MRLRFLLLLSVFTLSGTLLNHAQSWVEMMHDPNANFYDTKAAFDSAWSGIIPDKGKGYKVFKRWEDFMAPRVYPKGKVTDASRAYQEFDIYLAEHPEIEEDLSTRAANWTPMGPTGSPVNGGAGRINFVRFDPANSNIMYAGSPAGGLWKTTNGGTNWTTNTDQLAVIGCTDIAIDPTNSQILYLATGDGDAADTYSVGVLKSTDGGATWNTTGLAFAVNNGYTISRLLINPTNPQILLAATNDGVFRTTDGGATWPQVASTNNLNLKDMEFRPGDPTTVYACGTTFWKSTNSGSTFTQITNGVPTGVSRLAIAVTPANNGYVYMLAANNTNYGLTGVYRSTDNGTTFTLRDNAPNYLGYNTNGSDAGGQGWYDLAIAASPTNASEVVIGGINIWRSTDGGTSFALNAHWTGGGGVPYVHADIHDLIYLPGSGTSFYSGNDGGVWRTTNSGTAWTDISNQMQIAQQYRIGLAPTSVNILFAGHQDNGAVRYNSGVWTEVYGGDGMDCFIDRTSNTVFLESYVYGEYRRSANSGGTWTNCFTGLPVGAGNAEWLSPWHQDPTTAATFYAGGRAALYRSTNLTVGGGAWVTTGATPPGTGNILEFDIAPSNNQIIYTIKQNAVAKSTNAGSTWTNVTGTLPTASAMPSNIEISPTDPNKVWVTFSGYSGGNKVFITTNGGTSWTNYSTGLPNVPANCIVYQVGSATDIVYVGTDIGVFVRDNASGTWAPYLAGLPRVIVRDLEIYYGAPNKIRAGTYGRGTWESDLYTAGSDAPIADFVANTTIICPGQSVTFTDQSIYSPTSWSWSFPGGTPSTSNLQNPTVTYAAAGTYDVTLTATNVNGSDPEVKTGYIVVTGPQPLPLVEGFEVAGTLTQWAVTDANGDGVTWGITNSAGGFAASTSSMVYDNFNYNQGGTRDDIWTPKYSFTGLSSATLTFDCSYARYDATYSDTLSVWASTDCGLTFTQVFIEGGTTLANGNADQTAIFIPTTAGQWRTETVNLNAFVGQPSVMIAFRNHGRYGQPIWVDNINLTGVNNAPPTASFTTSGNSICVGQTVTYTNTSSGSTSISWNFPGGAPASGTTSPIVVTYNTAGTYTTTLTATNAFGNNTSTQVITVNALPTNTASNAGPYCVGGTIQLNATAGGTDYDWVGPNSYVQNNTQNPSITNATTLMAGVYTVTVTNAAGCTATATTSVIVNTSPTANATNTGPYCVGQTIQLNSVGGTPTDDWTGPSAYAVNNIQNPTRPAATLTMAGLYTVTVTNASGCTATATTNVVVNANPIATATNAGPYCVGQTIQLNSVGGSATDDWAGPNSYLQNNTQNPTIASATTLMAGVYTVTVTNASGCTSTATTTVVVNTNPTPTATNGGPYCVGATIQLNSPTGSATDDWAGPSAYSVSNIQNPTRGPATVAMAGMYTVTVTNASGCSATATTTVVVNTLPTNTASNTGPYCAGATIQLNATAGASDYDWIGPNSFAQNNTQNPTIAGSTVAATGIYTVTITNAAGCTTTSTTNVTVNALPNQTASNGGPYCVGANIQLNATAGATDYDWTGPATYVQNNTQNPIRAGATLAMGGVYTVTLTNAAGCTNTATTAVVVNTAPAATASNSGPFCEGSTIQLNSSGGGTYAWTGPSAFANATQNPTRGPATVAMGGIYTVTVTLGAGCTASATTTVVVNTLPTNTASNTGPYCAGATVQLNATAGATDYDWIGPNAFAQNNTQNPSIPASTVAASGIYTVTITNAAGCTTTSTTNVTVNAIPNQTASNAGPYCIGANIQLNATAGATDYDWTGPAAYVQNNTQNPIRTGATLAMGGVYTVTLTNAAGCTNTATTTVVVNTTPAATASNTGPFCEGSTIQLNSTGGGTYAWTGPSAFANATQNPTRGPATVTMAGVYTVTVTLGAGCTASATTTVVVNTLPTNTASNTGPYCAGATVQLNATAGATDYDWVGPNSFSQVNTQNPTIVGSTVAATGIYTVTITNAAGCTTTSTTNVTVNAIPSQTASNTGPYCAGSTIQLNATAGATDYDWVGPNSFAQVNTQNPSIVGSTIVMAGIYTVTLTNAAGCTNTSTTSVAVNSLPNQTASNTGPYCVGDNIQLNATAGATDYDWIGPNSFAQNNTQNPSIPSSIVAMAGTYTVTLTNAAGCTSTTTTLVAVNTLPNVIANASATTICEGQTVTLTGSGANSYTWDNSVINGVAFTPAASNTYSVIGTALSGCTNTAQVLVDVELVPLATAGSNSALCEGETLNLTSGGGVDFDWVGPNSFVQSNNQNPSVLNTTTADAGIYTVTVTGFNGCSATATTNVVINNAVNIVASSNGPICIGSNLDLDATNIGGAVYTWSGPNAFSSNMQNPSIVGVTGLESGVYMVTATSAGCSGTSTVNVIVNALPVATASSNSPVCEGATLDLSGSGGNDYDWLGPNSFVQNNSQNAGVTPVSFASAGTYTVTVTDANGCSATATVSASVIAAPSAPTITELNDTLFANPSVGFTYQWYQNGNPMIGEDSSIYVPGPTANYSVVITNGNGCTATSTDFAYVNTVSIEGHESHEHINVYPNPNDGTFNVTVSTSEAEFFNLKIYDMVGKVIYQQNDIPTSEFEGYKVDLTTVAVGTYNLIVYINGKAHNMKVVKK